MTDSTPTLTEVIAMAKCDAYGVRDVGYAFCEKLDLIASEVAALKALCEELEAENAELRHPFSDLPKEIIDGSYDPESEATDGK